MYQKSANSKGVVTLPFHLAWNDPFIIYAQGKELSKCLAFHCVTVTNLVFMMILFSVLNGNDTS